MKTKAGVWIDHRKAVVSLLTEEGENLCHITSEDSQEVQGEKGEHAYTRNDFVAEDKLERKNESRLNKYYDEVIACLHAAESIVILGPGEAKGELTKRLGSKQLQSRIALVQTADKMTDPQISAYVRRHFGSAATRT